MVHATKVPRSLVIAAVLNQIAQGMFITMPFSLAVYMVRYFEGPSADEARVGRLTGLLAAAATGAQTATSYAWGVVSDRVGRKPVLMTSNVFSGLSAAALGLSGSYRWAIAARVVGGLFSSGNSVTIKTIIAEASPDTHVQAVLMAQMVMGWGIGTVLGPLLGGLLANPCANWTMDLGDVCATPSGVLRRWPFLLPCLVAALASFLAVLQNALLMSETLPPKGPRGGPSRAGGAYQRLSMDGDGDAAGGGGFQGTREGGGGHEASAIQLTAVSISRQFSQHEGGAAAAEAAVHPTRPTVRRSHGHGEHGSSDSPGGGTALDASAVKEHAPLLRGTGGGVEHTPDTPWYRLPKVLGALCGVFTISFTFNVIDELTPIMGSASRGVGGLALPEHRMALPLAFSGVLLIAYNMLLFPRHQELLGQVMCVRVGMTLAAPAALLVPVSSLPASSAVMMGLLFPALGIKSVSKTMSLSSSAMLLNLLAPGAQRGAVNGASMTLASAARCIGPALSGQMWAAAVGIGAAGQQFVPFAVATACALGTVLLYTFVDLSVPPS